MALIVDLDISFNRMQDNEGIREKAALVNTTKAYIKNDASSLRNINWCYGSKYLNLKSLHYFVESLRFDPFTYVLNFQSVPIVISSSHTY
jgi:hypothetical protein